MIYVFGFLSLWWDEVFQDVFSFFPLFLAVCFSRENFWFGALILVLRFLSVGPSSFFYVVILLIYLLLFQVREFLSNFLLPALIVSLVSSILLLPNLTSIILSMMAACLFLFFEGRKRST